MVRVSPTKLENGSHTVASVVAAAVDCCWCLALRGVVLWVFAGVLWVFASLAHGIVVLDVLLLTSWLLLPIAYLLPRNFMVAAVVVLSGVGLLTR